MMVTENESTRANSSSENGKSSSALTALFASDLKISFEDAPHPSTSHDLSSRDVGDDQGAKSYHYDNSFYQSYGESFSLPTVIHEDISEAKTDYQNKAWVTVKELLSLVVEDATSKLEDSCKESLDHRMILNGEIDLLTKIDALNLFLAEEDGSPMDYLPPCNTSCDIFNMGVRDFLIVEKQSNLQLVHIRIEGNITDNEPYSGVLPSDQEIQVVGEDHPSLQRQLSDQTENSGEDSYYTLDDSDPRDFPDTIQFFRTDTEELRLHLMEQAREQQKNNNNKNNNDTNNTSNNNTNPLPFRRNSGRSHRHRSSSGNLLISYRKPGAQRWQVAKKFAVLTEQSLKEHDRHHESKTKPVPSRNTTFTSRQQEIANQVRKQLQIDTKEIPIPDPRWYTVTPKNEEEEGRDMNLNTEERVRRHSERPYDEERDGELGSGKYSTATGVTNLSAASRKYSTVSSRSSSMVELNPHTSTSLPALYSPAGSVMSRQDSDDDQLGLIQIERTKPFYPTPSSPAYFSDRSYGREEQTIHSLSIQLESQLRSHSHSHGSPGRHRHHKSWHDLSFDKTEDDEGVIGIAEEDDSESEGDGSSSDEDERLPNHLNVNTEVKLVPQTLKKHSSSTRFNSYRHLPHQIYKNKDGRERGGTETSSNHGSDKSSSRSSITSTKSALSRFFELFGGSTSSSMKKRPSFASESNDSVYSGTGTPKFRRSLVDSQPSQPPTPAPQQQIRQDSSDKSNLTHRGEPISLPIVQNLDTGDVFPVGALRYEAFKLPETVSPTVLFGNPPSDKIHR